MTSVQRDVRPALIRYGLVAMVLASTLMAPGIEVFVGADGRFRSVGESVHWDTWVVGLHLISDLLIGLAYVVISGSLLFMAARAKQAIPFLWTFVAFGVFIIACGFTHFVAALTLWTPVYWASAAIKIVTAVASVLTALIVPSIVPKIFGLIESARESADHKRALEESNRRLEATNELLRQSQQRFRSAFEDAAIGMGLVHPDGKWMQVNDSLCRLVGYTSAELLERTFQDITHPDDLARDLEYRRKILAGEIGTYCAEKRYLHKDGHAVWVLLTVSLVPDSEGKPVHFVAQVQDISERVAALEAMQASTRALEHQALHDALTQLPNRSLLRDRMHQAILAAQRDRAPLAFLLIDLDRFKEINDTFGHHAGDELLQQVATRFSGVMREEDTVARLGGDEFAVLLPASDVRRVQDVTEKLLYALRRPVHLEGQIFGIEASIGVALYPDHGLDASTLMRHADVAMYVAKRGGQRCIIYSPEQDDTNPLRLTLVHELRHAIEANQLTLHYQPQMNLATGRADHVEALVRWHHPTRGFLPPDQFISFAEDTGLIGSLTAWVLNAAIKQCSAWQAMGLGVAVAVNLSARSLHDADLVRLVKQALDRWNLPPGKLELEITENAIMLEPERALSTLSTLCDLGVDLAIDDFGTGYSSLGYLRRLPANQIKIDKSFVLQMQHNQEDAFIARSVVDLAHNLHRKVVAEGVEDRETWRMLQEMGCDFAQGYYWSRPLPFDDCTRWLQGLDDGEALVS